MNQADMADCPSAALSHNPLRLFVDGTRSMAGFTGGPEVFTVFDATLARIATELGIEEVTLFGESSRSGSGLYQTVQFTRELHAPSSYDRLNNPDYCLIRDLLQEDSSSVNLYLTDGVQSSESFGQQAPTVSAFRDWLNSGFAIEILAFTSEFNGPAWSEQRRAWIGQADVESRPFYLFVFASGPRAAEEVVNRIPPSLRTSATRMSFGPEPIECAIELGSTFYERDSNINWIYLNSPTGRTVSEEMVPAAVRCNMDESYPLASMVGEAEIEYYEWRGEGTGFEHIGVPSEVRIRTDSVTSAPGFVEIPIRTRLPLNRNIGFYDVRVSLAPGRTRTAVRQLSTESDANLNQFNRTYRFHWLIEPLIRTQVDAAQIRLPVFVLLEP